VPLRFYGVAIASGRKPRRLVSYTAFIAGFVISAWAGPATSSVVHKGAFWGSSRDPGRYGFNGLPAGTMMAGAAVLLGATGLGEAVKLHSPACDRGFNNGSPYLLPARQLKNFWDAYGMLVQEIFWGRWGCRWDGQAGGTCLTTTLCPVQGCCDRVDEPLCPGFPGYIVDMVAHTNRGLITVHCRWRR